MRSVSYPTGGSTIADRSRSAPFLSPAGALLSLAAAVLLCWPMLTVTAPLVYFDTVSYFTNGDELWSRAFALIGAGQGDGAGAAAAAASAQGGAQAAVQAGGAGSITFRSLAYAAFFYPAALTPLSLALVCILQTAMTLFVFLGLVPPLTHAGHRAGLAGFALVGTLSTLPWFASYAMPDILGAILPVFFALALGRADGLGLGQKLVLLALATFAILSHYGHLPLAVALAGAAVLWRALQGRLTRAALVFCLLPVAAAFAFNFAASLAVAALVERAPAQAAAAPAPGETLQRASPRDPATAAVNRASAPAGSETGASFAPNRVPVLLARSIDDGPARWYLEEECREVDRFAICEVFDEIPDRVWKLLWADEGLRSATPDQMARVRSEELEIVLAAARRYPLEQAEALTRNTLHQTMLVGTGELLPFPGLAADEELAALAPKTADNERNGVLQLFDWITPIFTGLAFIVLAWRVATGRSQRILVEATLMTLLVLLVNALVYGGLSAPVDRYQSRLVWLIPALLALDLALRPPGAPARRVARQPA